MPFQELPKPVHTNDIGIFIRDWCEHDNAIDTFDWSDPEALPVERAEPVYVTAIDASDASNLIVMLSTGDRYRVSITAL